MKTDVVNVEDRRLRGHLTNHGIAWIFNTTHSSHMGAVWERMICVARKILDSMFLKQGSEVTHEVLVMLIVEISAIINFRPIIAKSLRRRCSHDSQFFATSH